ncbi:MAG TPA: BMP family ABC transporter substrate-binding protein [Atribacteraceae bacterium]|nr:BMP family ABC transporter substrate-binding protein [Atribacteraceae bacterium]
MDRSSVGSRPGAWPERYRPNLDVTVEVSYVESFRDPAGDKEYALAHYVRGMNTIFALVGKTNRGVFNAAVEFGRIVIGVEVDQAPLTLRIS